MHALIIEDRDMISALIKDELRLLGYTSFDVAEREEAAIEAAEERCPDLITADDSIEGGTGVRAVQEICAERVIPVVFIADEPDKVVPPVPFAAVVGKPFLVPDLLAAIGEALVLAQRQAAMERGQADRHSPSRRVQGSKR